MATITITGDSRHISNIVRENRIRVKRGLIEISGDIADPKAKKPKKDKAPKKDKPEVEVKEENPEVTTKEEKNGPDSDKEEAPAKPAAKKAKKK